MSTLSILHLSDLHLLYEPQDTQRPLLRSLLSALQEERARRALDLAVVTGDIFNTILADERVKLEATQFFSALKRVLGEVPIIILPGNHDRRESGVIGPHHAEFFAKIKEFLAELPLVRVLDFTFGPLSLLLPREFGNGLAEIAALDSTRLLQGLFGAGGLIRHEDILLLDAELRHRETKGDEPLPLLLLMHHHLVPTPVTDRGKIQTESAGGIKRAAVQRLLPWLLANGDREELMMTALGAGTALSTLHAMGRAVIVLHGHKHYAAARLLVGAHDEDGDIVVAGAGSAGIAEPWQSSSSAEIAPIWPSFNVVSLRPDTLLVERVRFSPRESAPPRREAMVSLERRKHRWHRVNLNHEPAKIFDLVENLAHFSLKASTNANRYDVECERRITPAPGSGVYDYKELVEGAPGCTLHVNQTKRPGEPPFELMIPYETDLKYLLKGGACRTISEAESAYQRKGETYESLSLMNRYDAKLATLFVEGLPAHTRVFGSATDLGTGEERPQPITRRDGALLLQVSPCPARTLIKLYWILSPQ